MFLYCKVGFRSYLAYRILKQRGFTVATLSGGMLTFCGCHGTGICKGQPQPPLLSYAEARMSQTAAPCDADVRGATPEPR